MKSSSFEQAIQAQFDCLTKKVIKRAAMKYNRDISRRLKHEVSFSEISDFELNKSGVYDVSAKYSCGFPNPKISRIIVVERYLDYFTTITEDRLWLVLAKPVFR